MDILACILFQLSSLHTENYFIIVANTFGNGCPKEPDLVIRVHLKSSFVILVPLKAYQFFLLVAVHIWRRQVLHMDSYWKLS